MKRLSGIQVKASREENAFYRGLAAQLHVLPPLSLLVFHSQRTLDATLDAPFDVVLGDQVVARGELVAVGDRFGLRITEVAPHEAMG